MGPPTASVVTGGRVVFVAVIVISLALNRRSVASLFHSPPAAAGHDGPLTNATPSDAGTDADTNTPTTLPTAVQPVRCMQGGGWHPVFPNSSLHGRCSNLTVPPAAARGGDGHLLCTRRGGDAYYSIFSPAWDAKVDPYLECFPLGEELPEMKTPVLLQESVAQGKEGATCASPRGMVEELVRRRTAAIQAKPNGVPDAVLVYATTSAEFNHPADMVAASSVLYALSHGYIVHHVKAGPACGVGRNRTVPEGYPDPFLPKGGHEFCASGSASKCCWIGFYLTPYWMKAMALLQVSRTHKKVPWIVWLDTDVVVRHLGYDMPHIVEHGTRRAFDTDKPVVTGDQQLVHRPAVMIAAREVTPDFSPANRSINSGVIFMNGSDPDARTELLEHWWAQRNADCETIRRCPNECPSEMVRDPVCNQPLVRAYYSGDQVGFNVHAYPSRIHQVTEVPHTLFNGQSGYYTSHMYGRAKRLKPNRRWFGEMVLRHGGGIHGSICAGEPDPHPCLDPKLISSGTLSEKSSCFIFVQQWTEAALQVIEVSELVLTNIVDNSTHADVSPECLHNMNTCASRYSKYMRHLRKSAKKGRRRR